MMCVKLFASSRVKVLAVPCTLRTAFITTPAHQHDHHLWPRRYQGFVLVLCGLANASDAIELMSISFFIASTGQCVALPYSTNQRSALLFCPQPFCPTHPADREGSRTPTHIFLGHIDSVFPSKHVGHTHNTHAHDDVRSEHTHLLRACVLACVRVCASPRLVVSRTATRLTSIALRHHPRPRVCCVCCGRCDLMLTEARKGAITSAVFIGMIPGGMVGCTRTGAPTCTRASTRGHVVGVASDQCTSSYWS